jgi:hypothetical protein
MIFLAKIPFSCSLFNVAVWLLNHLWKSKNIVIFNKGLIADEYLTKNHPIRNLKMHCGNNEKSMKDTVKILREQFPLTYREIIWTWPIIEFCQMLWECSTSLLFLWKLHISNISLLHCKFIFRALSVDRECKFIIKQ